MGAPPYEVANLGAYVPSEIHLVPTYRLAEWVVSIVKVESPVHIREVSRRIAEAASVSRVGSRIRAAIESACAAASRTGKVRRSGDFLWRPDMREAPLRDRSGAPEALKKVELIAPEELAAAIEKVVADSFGMDRGEVPAAVLRLLLGFRRTTETAQQQVMRVLDGMVARRELNQEGSHVSLPD